MIKRSLTVVVALVAALQPIGASANPPDRPSHGRHIPNRAIVGATPNGGAQTEAAIRSRGGRVLSYYAPGDFFIVETPSAAPNWVDQMRGDPAVRYAELDYELTVDAVPNDPLYKDLWAMPKISMPAAWDAQTGSRDIVVGVIDTGVDWAHEDLAANMWTNPAEIAGNGVDDDNNGRIDDVYGNDCRNNDGNPMDDHGHGTHVAGTIGAVGNNTTGVTGVNWNVKVMALKFLSASGSGSTTDAIECLDYAVAKGAVLTNNSWGGGGFSQALYDAIGRARAANQLFVAAAGNSGVNTDSSPHYPSSYDQPNIVSVAATDQNDALASFSNYGATSVDLGAPGVGILSTTRNNTYGSKNGTSMAAPHVAGAAALLCAAYPGFKGNYAALKDRLLVSGDLVIPDGRTVSDGRLNVAAALALGPPPDLAPVVSFTSPSAGQIVTGTVTVTASASDDYGVVSVQFLDGTTSIGTDTEAPWSVQWDTTAVAEGAHTLKAIATDTAGKTSTATVEVTVSRTAPAPINLSARGYKVKGLQKVDLSWTGATGPVDVYRDGRLIHTTSNATYTDPINVKGSGTYVYKVCPAGSTTGCSNEAKVVF